MTWAERAVRLVRLVPRPVRLALRDPTATLQFAWYECQFRLGRVVTLTPVEGWTLRCHPASRAFFASARDVPGYEIADFRRWARPGMRLVDVGAHMGFYTLAALHFGGETSRVLAVEPSPAARRILMMNLALACATSRVTVVPVALGASGGALPFLTTGARACWQLVPAGGARPDATFVPTLTLDDLLARTGFAPTHLKIDVEGCEGEVLAGARTTLRVHRPILFLELHGALLRAGGRDPETVLASLAAHGYDRLEFQGRPVGPREVAGMWVARLVCPPKDGA
jgi:FkbM family methyltransferase